MSELADRHLLDLLNYVFAQDNVPQDKRDALLAKIALRDLADKSHPMSARDRDAKLQEVADGLAKSLDTLNDPQFLVDAGETLAGILDNGDVNTLEYWGETPALQAKVRPLADVTVKMFARAATLAQALSDKLANNIQSPTDPAVKQYENAFALANRATYDKGMSEYYLAISIDPADPQRVATVKDALATLAPFDDPSSQVQSVVRLREGKLQIVGGDYDNALKAFASITASPSKIKPAPTVSDQFNAYYFSVIADIQAKQPDDAVAALASLNQFLDSAFGAADASGDDPAKAAQRKAADAAVAVLQYRLDSLQASVASDPDAKQKANAAAVAVLQNLLKTQPGLRAIVLERLIDQMGSDVDLKTLDPLLLQAFVQKGEDELRKTGSETPNTDVIQRAFEAGKEYLSRASAGAGDNASSNSAGAEDFDPNAVQETYYALGIFAEKLGDNPGAADAFLDYVQRYPNSKNARPALDEAASLIFHMHDLSDEPAAGLLARFYPLAVNPPFNYRAFEYDYARVLQRQGKTQEAIAAFQQVPDDDKRIIFARFFLAVALRDELDEGKLDADQKQQIVTQILSLADQVKQMADAAAASASDPKMQQAYRGLDVKIALLAADLARRQQKDPQKALDLLANFEQTVQGLPDAKALLSTALFLRVQAYMDLGRNTDATAQLIQYLNAANGAEGAETVRNLLLKLSDDLDKARAAGDTAAALKIANDRATLSEFLVKWATDSTDPKIHAFAYRYRVYDATTHRLSADLQTDPAARQAGFADAMSRYQALTQPSSVAEYQQTIPAGSGIDPNYPDPQVLLGLGLTAYALGDWKTAQANLGRLINDKKLGQPTIVQTDPATGAEKTIDNDQYWEALYKLLDADTHLAQSGDPDTPLANVKQYLISQYILWQDKIGGAKWHDAFTQLKAQLIPDFKIPGDAGPATGP